MAGVYGHGEYGKATGMAADSYTRFMVRPSAPMPPPSSPRSRHPHPTPPRSRPAYFARPETRGAKTRPAVEGRDVSVYQAGVFAKVRLRGGRVRVSRLSRIYGAVDGKMVER